MPRRRRALKARIGGVTPGQRRWFLNPFAQLHGPTEATGSNGQPLFRTEAEARALWDALGERWTAEYERTYPGERPPAWERYGAPRGGPYPVER